MDIRIEGLTKRYGNQKAIDGISFEVKTGEIVGFLGPNGAGKSTTMKIITGYLLPDEGRVEIGGQVVDNSNLGIRRNIGYLPESNPLYYDMAVPDYLAFAGSLHGLKGEELRRAVRENIVKCGLQPEKHKRIGELSKGYKQRVGLAQAMISNPDILILDEPTSGLDPNQIIEIRKLIRQLGKEKTVILSTHILQEVEATCDRIIIINNGKIAADGTAGKLKQQEEGREILVITIEDGEQNDVYNSLQLLAPVGLVDFADRSKNRFSVQSKPGLSSKREIFKLCSERGWVLTEMTIVENKLEDIFRNLTKNPL
jgi:ABC-2 type transport system ATP-binding protein